MIKLKYPDDFNTPAFPAGKFVAVSRFMATVVMIVFFIIIVVCGIIFWTKKTQDINPFLVSVSPNGERWSVVVHDNHRKEIPASYVLQESMLDKFVHYWFTISDDTSLNLATWATTCKRESPECSGTSGNTTNTCAIYCDSSDTVFDEFKKVVLPTYSMLESEYAEIWTVRNVRITPMDSIDNIALHDGGLWKINVLVQTNQGNISFIGYARTSRDKTLYKRTMGYYVSEFNTYRIN